MSYSKISVTKRGVTLERETRIGNDKHTDKLESTNRPMGSFVDAMQGFAAFFIELLDGAIVIDPSQLTITTLNFSEDKNGLLGLIMTGIVPVPNAYDRPLVLNTPLVRQAGELALEDACTIPDEVMDLIDLVRKEAQAFEDGQYQAPDAEPQLSENAKNVDDRMAAAEVGSTRKTGKTRNGKKNRGNVTSQNPGEVLNPESTSKPMTTPQLRQLLLSVERDVPEDQIERWTATERTQAQAWGEARQKELIGQLESTKVPTEPACVTAASNTTLADAWSDQKPPKPDIAAIDQIKTAAQSPTAAALHKLH